VVPQRDNERSDHSRHCARVGLLLFGIYVLLYAGFIAIVVFQPNLLVLRPLGGVNAAIVYGMGLIAAALLLSLVYMVLCREPAGRD
jgi:uncharacterized membrane protein (DUF485 family)